MNLPDQREQCHAEKAGKLAYLVDKFFVMLGEGQKILMFKQNPVIAPEAAQAILAAVGAYGDCSLLYVDPQQPGEVVGNGLPHPQGRFAMTKMGSCQGDWELYVEVRQ